MIEYTIKDRLIRVRMSGSNSSADMERHYEEVYNDPRYDVMFSTLFHIDPNAGGQILEELPRVRQLMELVAESQKAEKKWAVVMPSAFKRAVVEFLLKDVQVKPIQIRFFGSEEDALVWLNQGITSVPTGAG